MERKRTVKELFCLVHQPVFMYHSFFPENGRYKIGFSLTCQCVGGESGPGRIAIDALAGRHVFVRCHLRMRADVLSDGFADAPIGLSPSGNTILNLVWCGPVNRGG